MRLAVSGTHLVGKTTLAEALADVLPGYRLVIEPYLTLADEGFEFSEQPSLEEFEAQLERAILDLDQISGDAIFDRCPLDPLGYLTTHQDRHSFQLDRWLSRIRDAVAGLDLIVFVPIEIDDPIAVPRTERHLRVAVDRTLREIVVDDRYGFDLEAIEVTGPPGARLQQVLRRIAHPRGR